MTTNTYTQGRRVSVLLKRSVLEAAGGELGFKTLGLSESQYEYKDVVDDQLEKGDNRRFSEGSLVN